MQDIEKLPLLLVGLTREAMNRRKSDRTTVEAGEATAMLSGIGIKEIPPIDFFAATEAKDGAQVTLKVARADKTAPLLASWQYGLGRSRDFRRRSRFTGDAQLDSMEPLRRILVAARELDDAPGRLRDVHDARPRRA